MMNENKIARKLLHTEKGIQWLNQFEELDREMASSLANNLTLISHNEFERNLTLTMTRVVENIPGPIAFFAIREMERIKSGTNICTFKRQSLVPYYQQAVKCDNDSVIPLGNTADIGSEGRVAAIIRQFCKKNKNVYLNHPTLERLRITKCKSIVCIDDFIGSGSRAFDFIDALWMERTIRSWHSSKVINFHVIAYSGIENGIEYIRKHKSSPSVHIYRDAPTFDLLPWSKERKEELYNLCKKYGRRANKKKSHMWLGFKETMCALVFEHGCPNNVPAILVEDNKNWIGLFPARIIPDTTLSIFPSQITLNVNMDSLVDVGQKKLRTSTKLIRRGEVGKIIIIILALVAKGKHKRATLCFATGLNNDECDKYLSFCIKWEFVSPQKRITPAGLAELKAAKRMEKLEPGLLDKGTDYYYPIQLRSAT